jgi:pre-mRNA cleavage complex 2 protein Pcf11
MQNILDDMQTDVNEVDKISLERLAQVNPELLAKVKLTAVEGLGSSGSQKNNGLQQQGNNGATRGSHSSGRDDTSFMAETRSPEQLERAKAWANVFTKTKDAAPALVEELAGFVEKYGDEQYTQPQAMEMTQYLAAASATAQLLQTTLERIQTESDQKKNLMLLLAGGGVGDASSSLVQQAQILGVDPTLFTNEGIKNKIPSVIAILYEVGLPFVSSTDGRRFRTQLELSKHLDGLFKKNQLEKSIAKTEERGWYVVDLVWAGEVKEEDLDNSTETGPNSKNTAASLSPQQQQTAATEDDGYSPETSTVPADETRDRCVVCGINFKMFFDNDDGMYKYGNCREIELLNDAEISLYDSDNALVHVTCWRGLGSPNLLTMDQALH